MNPLQKASVRRKAYYFGAILALFTVSMFWRGTIPIPLSGSANPGAVNRLADRVAARTIRAQATRLDLWELDQGDPEIAGSIARLALTGSRGFVVTYLWKTAIDKQKRNDFHEFDLLVRQVTTLQPHFISPWLFQSWNITYNVSVEMHDLGDMYYYIARGIELLAEGERRNKRSPDMRYTIGFYYQNKFGVSDQVQTLRCLFQLSCMPPNDRDPDALMPGGALDRPAFERFCEKHPHFVRRLRGSERRDATDTTPGVKTSEGLRTDTPEDVVEFLRAHRNLPSRYKNSTELADPSDQFPVLPPRFNEGPNEANPKVEVGDAFSGYLAARAWFAYANVLVPPTPRDAAGNPVPSPTPRPGAYDPFQYRVPRQPMLILFKQGPPRAQTYQADMLQKDGWFDGSGWEVDAGLDESNAWFPNQRVVVGAGTPWSLAGWEEAYRMWKAHGEENGLLLDEDDLAQLRENAGLSPGATGRGVGYPGDPTPEQRTDPAFMKRFAARSALFYYYQNRDVTNFPYFLESAKVEAQPETVEARKVLWQADQARRRGNKLKAIELYESGLGLWKEVLRKNPAFHRGERSETVEEQTYEYELEYLRLIAQDDPRVREKAREEYAKAVRDVGLVAPFVGAATDLPAAAQRNWYAVTAEKFFAPFRGVMAADDLPPGDPRAGTPWVQEGVKQTILNRQGVAPAATGGGSGG